MRDKSNNEDNVLLFTVKHKKQNRTPKFRQERPSLCLRELFLAINQDSRGAVQPLGKVLPLLVPEKVVSFFNCLFLTNQNASVFSYVFLDVDTRFPTPQ